MKITSIVNSIIINAYEEAKANKDEYVTAEHLLYEALFQDIVANAAINCGADLGVLKNNIKGYLEEYVDKVEDITDYEPIESFNFQQVILQANAQAQSSGKDFVDIDNIINAIFNLEDSYARYYLLEQGVNKADFLYELCHRDKELSDNEENKEDIIDKYTLNLTELMQDKDADPLIGRTDILKRSIQILCRRNKNNPIHIGESGVGKTAITLGLAKLILEGKVPEKLKNAQIFSLDLGSMLAGTKYRGDFEERIKKVLESIKLKDNPIVYIDEIHNVVGAGALGSGSLDASNLLKPYLVEGKIRFIGATTFDEYKKYFEKDKSLNRRFQKIEVKEPSIQESIDILEGLKENYENYHKVKYTQEAIRSAVILSDKYISDKYLPDKAIDIIDEAGAHIGMMDVNDTENYIIDEKIIEEIISKMCNIPKKTIESNEINSLKHLGSILKENIFGQDSAVDEVVRCIKMSRAGLNEDNKPVASMLFVGPTGVGKTEIARNLAKHLGIDLVRFDMSEYGEKHAASKLIGSPPGYVGYEEGGLLTDAIRKKPHCVLLLDEVEKAHSDILNVLLQVMDYATLTDNQGRKADFRNVIIIMTSNAGAKNLGKSISGFGEREIKSEAITDEVKKVFSPEFRNRLDKIVVFNNVDTEMATNIVRKELDKFVEKLKTKGVIVNYSQECVNYIAKVGISKEYGAREIIRVIESKIKPLFVDEILFGQLSEGGFVNIELVDVEFRLKILLR